MRTLLAMAGALGLSAVALSAGRTPPDIPINLWFGSSTQGLTSDGGTVFYNNVQADYIDGQQNVSAVIQGGGNFRLLTQSNTRQPVQRFVDINFGSQTANAMIPFFPSGLSDERVNVVQAVVGFPLGSATTAIADLHPMGSTMKIVRWNWDESDGYSYHLGYGSDVDRDGVPDSPPVVVNCVEPANDATAACAKWTMAPVSGWSSPTEAGNPAPDGTAVYWRTKILKGGNEGSPQLIGYYVMPFSETFTRK